MSDTADNQENNAADTTPQKPPFVVVHQYLKDLSVEVPNAPHVFQTPPSNPEMNVNVDITIQQLAEKDFEISLHLNASAKQDDVVLHQSELVYAAIVSIGEISQEMLQAILFIEVPRLTFPFARQILASSIQSTGFPPINLSPIDFVDMFQTRVANAQAETEAAEAGEEKETADA